MQRWSYQPYASANPLHSQYFDATDYIVLMRKHYDQRLIFWVISMWKPEVNNSYCLKKLNDQTSIMIGDYLVSTGNCCCTFIYRTLLHREIRLRNYLSNSPSSHAWNDYIWSVRLYIIHCRTGLLIAFTSHINIW
jgi:hypothetical protein